MKKWISRILKIIGLGIIGTVVFTAANVVFTIWLVIAAICKFI